MVKYLNIAASMVRTFRVMFTDFATIAGGVLSVVRFVRKNGWSALIDVTDFDTSSEARAAVRSVLGQIEALLEGKIHEADRNHKDGPVHDRRADAPGGPGAKPAPAGPTGVGKDQEDGRGEVRDQGGGTTPPRSNGLRSPA